VDRCHGAGGDAGAVAAARRAADLCIVTSYNVAAAAVATGESMADCDATHENAAEAPAYRRQS
jgi:hypothetical protein